MSKELCEGTMQSWGSGVCLLNHMFPQAKCFRLDKERWRQTTNGKEEMQRKAVEEVKTCMQKREHEMRAQRIEVNAALVHNCKRVSESVEKRERRKRGLYSAYHSGKCGFSAFGLATGIGNTTFRGLST